MRKLTFLAEAACAWLVWELVALPAADCVIESIFSEAAALPDDAGEPPVSVSTVGEFDDADVSVKGITSC
ncbi:hypothetical protein A6X21_11505 [Planctopirus hydrillae]|uniref:Uncharacterized protein n=1 Tax=Planctopirus hydrillae TaxID=1841610 RepID=A0A1C3E576_9PLAN|nr:hypothetical protein A6X21_11505 [Planctopirus hydrillae]